MNLFRSEEHIDAWLGERKRGATIGVEKLSELANAWWHDRLADDWRPHTLAQNQTILDRLDLTGDFWRLS